jgi:PAS domain-containing protein
MRELETARESLKVAQDEHELLLRSLPVAYITTGRSGEIRTANPEAALLLNASMRHLTGKSLLLFLEDRNSWEATLRNLLKFDPAVRRSTILRPRERARRQMLASVSCVDGDTLRWFLVPIHSQKD